MMKKYLTPKYIAGTIIAVLVVALVARIAVSEPETQPIEERIPVVELVDVESFRAEAAVVSSIGEVESLTQVELRAQVSESVRRIPVGIGDPVVPGQVLIELDAAQLATNVDQAEASLQAAEAQLDELRLGLRPEALQVQESRVVVAQMSLADARDAAIEQLRNMFTQYDDAVRNRTDIFFSNPRTQQSRLTLLVTDTQLGIDIENSRRVIESRMAYWENVTADLDAAQDLLALLGEARTDGAAVQAYLDKLASAVNRLIPSVALPQATIDGYKTTVSLARTTVNSVVTALAAADDRLEGAQTALDLVEDELTLSVAGATTEQLTAQEARVAAARAALSATRVQVGRTVITSPVRGVVAGIPVRVGDVVSPGMSIVSVVSRDGLQVKLYVTAEDRALIREGAAVRIEDGIDGVITRVAPSLDPATKKVEVVAAVSAKGGLSGQLLVGELVNIDLTVGEALRERGTYLVPLGAVRTGTDGAYVYTVRDDARLEQRSVELGRIIGENIEIVHGIDGSMRIVAAARGLQPDQVVRTGE